MERATREQTVPGKGTRARALACLALLASILGALGLLFAAAGVVRAPAEPATPALVVNDVSGLNPIPVSAVVTPTTTGDVVQAVRDHPGPISVGGARHSMGGQIATGGALHLDMRRFDRILDFSPATRRITVQSGVRWRAILERIDPENLSVEVMQSYASFTVGGSLSANVHGRYVGLGPIILSVDSLEVVLADGSTIQAGPIHNSDVFHGVIGGYGGLGVITRATLRLTENVKVKRQHRTMALREYRRYFVDHIRSAPDAVLHNGDIYPDGYGTVRAVTYTKTDAPVTIEDRLRPHGDSYRTHRLAFWVVSEWPFGKAVRQQVVDPWLHRGEPVTWRNYEASFDAAELEPASRSSSTYVLQEYFVPVDRFDTFAGRMREVLRRHDVNVINVSVRHAGKDPGSLLAWARTEVFAFVIYYKQGTDVAARQAVGAWTRELIEAALALGGSFYLPYQLHATGDQFLRAYPRAAEFFALKRRLDPANKFRNQLWDTYYRH